MTIDSKARRAADTVHEYLSSIPVPEPRTVVRRARHRRLATRSGVAAALVLVTLGATALVARDPDPRVEVGGVPTVDLPAGSVTAGDWTLVRKAAAGVGDHSSLSALASDGNTALLGGATSRDGRSRPVIWRSTDGVHWTRTDAPEEIGDVATIAMHGDTALAIGSSENANFVWRSSDGGMTWDTLPGARSRFGDPAPDMDRPYVAKVVFSHGWWVASGGASDGWAAIWISRDGDTWRQVLAPRDGGSFDIVEAHGGKLFAFGLRTSYLTDDPTSWGDPRAVDAPPGTYLRSVADGARLALAANFARHDTATPLLRSTDTETWMEESSFLRDVPGAWGWKVEEVGGVAVVAGTIGVDGDQSPLAWVTSDFEHWQPLPAELRGAPGGILSLVTSVDGRIVMFGGAPELDRFYTFEPR